MFDDKSFMKSPFKARTATLEVKELAEFFKNGKPTWEVRGLTGAESAMVNEACAKNKTLAVLSEALTGDDSEKMDAFKELFGIATDEVPGDIVRRKEILVLGSVKPVCSEELAVKLADTYPTVFFYLTNEILKLTGLGKEPGKPKPSGKTKK